MNAATRPRIPFFKTDQQQASGFLACARKLADCFDQECFWRRMLSRDETLLLKATGTSSEMPGGMERLIHYKEYKANVQNVQLKFDSYL
jgi:hypothetical protein